MKVFINTKGTVGEISKELKALLDYIDSGIISDWYTKKLDREVVSAKNKTKWRFEYMTLDMIKQEEREEALAEGIAIGEKQGIVIGEDRIKALVRLLITDGRTDELKHLDENCERLLNEYSL